MNSIKNNLFLRIVLFLLINICFIYIKFSICINICSNIGNLNDYLYDLLILESLVEFLVILYFMCYRIKINSFQYFRDNILLSFSIGLGSGMIVLILGFLSTINIFDGLNFLIFCLSIFLIFLIVLFLCLLEKN